MKKAFASFLVFFVVSKHCLAQQAPDKNRVSDYVSPPAIGVHFLLNDFTTPQRLRSSSLSRVLQDKQLAKLSEMYPGIGITYYKGLLNHIDFAGSFNASFAKMQIDDNNGSTDNNLLIEVATAVNFKILTDRYVVDPYVTAGIGVSRYKSYYGAFMPLGIGIKINIFNEAAIILSSQYYIPVTAETSNYHFVHSIGIAGILKPKKQTTVATAY